MVQAQSAAAAAAAAATGDAGASNVNLVDIMRLFSMLKQAPDTASDSNVEQ